MDILENILSQQIIQRLGWTLVHFVWQAAAVALLLAILLRLLRKSTAHLRYIIACIALALIVLMPAATLKMLDVPAETFEPVKLLPVDLPKAEFDAPPIVQTPPVDTTPPLLPAGASKIPLKDKFVAAVDSFLPFIVVAWLVGVFGLSIWHLGGWAQLQRLRRKMVKQVAERVNQRLKYLAEKLGIKRTVEIAESALVQVPAVVGWLRPVILLPASALTGLSGEQLEAILAHELAHIKRCDYLVNILQTAVEILGFYHPAVWWVSHKIRAERENCCDDLAVSISGDRVAYARALTSMEEVRTGYTLAVAASGGGLFDRIRRLLGKDTANEGRQSWLPSVIAIVLIMALVIPTALALSSKSKTDLNSARTSDLIHLISIAPEEITIERLADICEGMESAIIDIAVDYEWYRDPPAKTKDIAGTGMLITLGPEERHWSTARPFSERSLTILSANFTDGSHNNFHSITKQSFNGKIGKHLQIVKRPNKPESTPDGTITKSRRFMEAESLSPKTFSIFHFRKDGSLSKILKMGEPLEIELNKELENINGYKTIHAVVNRKFENGRNVFVYRVYFAVDHGYTPVRFEHTNGREVVYRVDVTKLEEVAKGLWYPASGRLGSTKEDFSNVYEASKIIVNQGLAAEYFDIEFPPGTDVTDEISNKEYVFKPTKEQEEQQELKEKFLKEHADEVAMSQKPGGKMYSLGMLLKLGTAKGVYMMENDRKFPREVRDLKSYLDEEAFSWLVSNVIFLDIDKESAKIDPAKTPFAYDKTFLKKGEGTNVLYNDFHVTFEGPEKLKKLGITTATNAPTVQVEVKGKNVQATKLTSSFTRDGILKIWQDQERRLHDIYINFDFEETIKGINGKFKASKRENIMYMSKGNLFRTRKQVFVPKGSNHVANDWEFSADGMRKYYCNRTGPHPDGTVENSLPEQAGIKHTWVIHYLSSVYRMPRKKGNAGHECNLIGALEEAKTIEVTEELFEGRKAVVLTRPNYSKVYLDPMRNLAVLGSEATGQTELTFKCRNSNFVEVAEGIWMPLQTERTFKQGSDLVIRKTKVKKLKVNNNYTKEDFRIKFEPGISVRDINLKPHVQVEDNDPAARLRDEELHQRSESIKKLKRLGSLLRMYASDHDERYPYGLELIKRYDDKNEVVSWALENVGYLGRGRSAAVEPQALIAYDKTMLLEKGCTNLLFNDSHVEFCEKKRVKDTKFGGISLLDIENRWNSAQNLSDLGKAMLIFACNHDDRYPQSLDELSKADWFGKTELDWLKENVEYLGYKEKANSLPAAVLAYDKTLLEKGEGTNVLYNDCRVKFEKPEKLKKLGITAGQAKERVVHFPEGRSLGTLYIRDGGSAGWYEDWQKFSEAKGDISIPADKELKLEVSEAGVSELSALSQLRADDLQMLGFDWRKVTLGSLAPIGNLRGLKALNLQRTRFEARDFKYLTGLGKLEVLRLGDHKLTDESMRYIGELTSLRSLALWGTGISDEGLKHLQDLRNLTFLALNSCDITDEGLGYLENMTSLEGLQLTRTKITDEGLSKLKGLSGLKSILIAYNNNITDTGLKHLQGLTSLEIIGAENTSVSDKGLSYLSDMRNLEGLTVFRTKVTDAGMAHLSNLKTLRHLTMSDIGDKGVEQLSKLPALKKLQIMDARLTKASIGNFEKMRSLERLLLSGDEIGDDLLQTLRAALPDCKIWDPQRSRDYPMPEWRTKFEAVYRLEDGQILKRITPPFITERRDYYINEHSTQAEAISRSPGIFVFHWVGKLKNWGLSFSSKNDLNFILYFVLRLKSFEYDGPEELLALELPGDWIIRDDASQKIKLKALEQLIAEELDRSIQFEKRTVERQVIVATGSFEFHPSSETYENKSVHLYTDELDPDEGSGGGTADSVNDFILRLGSLVNMPVVVHTESSKKIKIPYRHHRSSYLRKVKDEDEKKRKLEMLLTNLTKQTNLQFKLEQRPVDVWFVTEGNEDK